MVGLSVWVFDEKQLVKFLKIYWNGLVFMKIFDSFDKTCRLAKAL